MHHYNTRGVALSYSNLVMPADQRVGKWSLTMAWWALFSAMFWIYVAVASAGAVGVPNTMIGMVLTIATYGIINLVLSRYAARTGLTECLLPHPVRAAGLGARVTDLRGHGDLLCSLRGLHHRRRVP